MEYNDSKHFHINYELHIGEYESFGHPKYRYINTEALDEFMNYIYNESEFKGNKRLLLCNFSHISFAYLSLENYGDSLHLPRDKPLHNRELSWLKSNHKRLYNSLMKNKQVIVAYALINTRTENYNSVDIIESRIKRNGLASSLLRQYKKITGKVCIPNDVTEKSKDFWIHFLNSFNDKDVSIFIDVIRKYYGVKYNIVVDYLESTIGKLRTNDELLVPQTQPQKVETVKQEQPKVDDRKLTHIVDTPTNTETQTTETPTIETVDSDE